MPKGSISDTRAATDLVRFRESIRELEIACADLKGRGEAVVALLTARDALQLELDRLTNEEGLDLRPERTRIETIDNILVRKTPQISRELRRFGGWDKARQEHQPPRQNWWWFNDLDRAQKQRSVVIRWLVGAAVVLALIWGGNAYLEANFGMSPEEKEARSRIMEAEQYLRDGKTDKAIVTYEQANQSAATLDAYAALVPLYEQAGELEASREAAEMAKGMVPQEAIYYIALAKSYQQTRDMDGALEAIDQALVSQPQSPEAHMVKGGIFEEMANITEALDEYTLAADYATEQGQDELYVLAKMRLGMLMQSGPSMTQFGGPVGQ